MKYLIPFMFLLAFAMPLPAHAQKADPACVLDNCPKTDPAQEAEKEMSKGAGIQVPIEAPVEGAAAPKPVTPMQANEAIREIEQAIAKETIDQKISEGGLSRPAALRPSGQTPSCAPLVQNQKEVAEKVLKNEAHHVDEQKRINNAILDGIRHHKEEQLRIGQVLKDATALHAKGQQEQMAASVEYQRRLKEEGLVIREKLASNVRQHKEEGIPLRCLTTEKLMTFFTPGSISAIVQPQAQGGGRRQ